MPLNIKDEEVHRKARRLAELTGQTITSAVREAVDERLRAVETEQRWQRKRRTPETLLAMAREVAALAKPGGHSSDHADLYDEDGLPR